MSQAIRVPELGDGITQGNIIAIHVSPGEQVAEGQTLIEVETDKVVLEVPADRPGIIKEVCLAEGASASPGDTIVFLEPLGADGPAGTTSASDQTAAESQESVAAEVKAERDDTQEKITAATGGEALAPIVEADEAIIMPAGAAGSSTSAAVPAGPSARRLARELGIEIGTVSGTGPRGRITKADVKSHAKRALTQPSAAPSKALPPLPDLSAFGPVRREPLSAIARATAQNMAQAWERIPHAWLQDKIDITELEMQRQLHKQSVRDAGASLTVTALIVKAMSSAIKKFPVFNAAYDEQSNEMVYREYIDIGVAVDTSHGLVVPKIRRADQLGLTDIALELGQISERAKKRKLSMEDLSGAGITVSNLGGMGLTGIQPIVNWPQVAILGVAASEMEPRYVNDELQKRLMMPITLAFDHRIINGADGARFLQYLKSLLEQPFSLLL